MRVCVLLLSSQCILLVYDLSSVYGCMCNILLGLLACVIRFAANQRTELENGLNRTTAE